MRHLLPLALLALSTPAAAQEPRAAAPAKSAAPAKPAAPAKAAAPLTPREQRALHLMQVTGAGKMGMQVMDMMMAQFQGNASVPPEFLTRLRQKMDPDALVRLMVPVYTAHLSEQDIEAAIRFYESPAGKSFVEAQPKMMQEAGALSQKWAMDAVQSLQAEMEAEAAAKPAPTPKK